MGGMRWQGQLLEAEEDGALPGMRSLKGLLRTVTVPDFPGVRFHEVAARSVLNEVPASSPVPFRWTVNPYRGCTHACVYCFARGTHAWLDLDTGRDFDTEIVVKVNVAEQLRTELARPSWTREPVALGTNTDPYQRAEGRYRLMPGIVTALARAGTPLSVLTKGTLLRRDLPLFTAAAADVEVGLGMSIAILDPELHELLEPGTPTPQARLRTVEAVREAGLGCYVLLAPVLPWLTDDDESLDAALGAIAAAGATGVSAIALHLRPGARQWFLRWLGEHRPDLVPRYRRLYRGGSYADPRYRRWLAGRVARLVTRHGLDRGTGTHRVAWARQADDPAPSPVAEQLSLL
jgi:DNA repair photolyase